MPYISAPACNASDCTDQLIFPITAPSCVCETASGGISEIYFIPCAETFSEANVTNITWWQGLADDNKIGRSGIGLGSIGKKGTTTARVASCRAEQITMITWALKFTQRCFDKTSARSHCAKMNSLINSFSSYLAVARMCDGADTILPIGVFTTSDTDWIVPENSEDTQSTVLELSWKELSLPCTVDVAGLSTVLAKLT